MRTHTVMPYRSTCGITVDSLCMPRGCPQAGPRAWEDGPGRTVLGGLGGRLRRHVGAGAAAGTSQRYLERTASPSAGAGGHRPARNGATNQPFPTSCGYVVHFMRRLAKLRTVCGRPCGENHGCVTTIGVTRRVPRAWGTAPRLSQARAAGRQVGRPGQDGDERDAAARVNCHP